MRSEDSPESLARAYREAARRGGETSDEARAILDRLFARDTAGRWCHLRPLLLAAWRRVPPHQHWQEAADLFQDTLTLILECLSGPRGRLAEVAWHAFCHQRLVDAWRQRHGRRGERLEPPRQESDEMEALLESAALPPWHGAPGADDAARLESRLRRAVERIADPTIRAVAEDQWLSAEPSPISAAGENRPPPLTQRLGKSRFQIYRALEAARARVRLELEHEALRGTGDLS